MSSPKSKKDYAVVTMSDIPGVMQVNMTVLMSVDMVTYIEERAQKGKTTFVDIVRGVLLRDMHQSKRGN